MYIIIIGGGKVGYYLAKTLSPFKHRIVVIEKDKELCMKIVNELNDLGIAVINGDGTDLNYLVDADIERADALIAVTGYDQDNLIVCQLAKRKFSIPRTIARVNNPKNIKIFKELGVDVAVSSTAYIADLIEKEVDISNIKTLMSIKDSKLSINEVTVSPNSFVAGKAVRDLNFPDDCILIAVIRDSEATIPNGLTLLQAGDLVIAVTKDDSLRRLKDYFEGE